MYNHIHAKRPDKEDRERERERESGRARSGGRAIKCHFSRCGGGGGSTAAYPEMSALSLFCSWLVEEEEEGAVSLGEIDKMSRRPS